MSLHRAALRSARRPAALGLLILPALSLWSCCTLSKVWGIIAPPGIEKSEAQELARWVVEAPTVPAEAAADRTRIDLEDAERCDFLDPSRCLLPFPSDYFTVENAAMATGRQVRLARESMPRNAKNEPVDPEAWRWSDGFSPGAMILTHVPGLDLEATGAPLITDLGHSLEADSPMLLIDAETGDRHLFWAELDAQAQNPASRALILRQAVNLEEGRRYLVALRRLKDTAGRTIPPARAFEVYRDRIPHGAPAVERRRPHMEEIFERLVVAGVERADLYLAWDFTVASTDNLSERLLHMRDDAFASLGDEAPGFKVLCKKKDRDIRRVWGSFEVPRYLKGKGGPGSRLNLGDDGLPVRTGTFTAYFSCIIPRRAFEEPARISLYGHGLLNSLDEVGAGDLQDMANEHNFVFCATNWSGLSVPDTLQALRFLQDASEFPAVADRLHQGILNTLFLGRLMIHPEGFRSHRAFQGPGGAPLIDTGNLVFDGNSQGTVIGGVATAVAQDWTRATLGVPGMNYSLFLNRSADFAEPRFEVEGIEVPSFQEIFHFSYRDELDRPLVLALIQMLWDRAELNGHAQHLIRAPYPETPRHEVLLHEAFGDQALANVATEALARTLGAHIYQPALREGRDPRPDPHFGIPAIPGLPFDGSALVVWDDGSCPTPLDNTAPKKESDPHGVVRRQASARLQKAEFLKPDGRVIDVCDGKPCQACGGQPCVEFCSAP